MHSRIFQLSTKRLPKDEWIDDNYFVDDYAYFGIDYTGESEDRKGDIEWLKEILPEKMFKVEGNKITIINNGECLFGEYKKDLIKKATNLIFEAGEEPGAVLHSFVGVGAYEISQRAKRIIDTDMLFSIEGWNNLGYSNDLVEYAHFVFKNGKSKTLYINGILDYHF